MEMARYLVTHIESDLQYESTVCAFVCLLFDHERWFFWVPISAFMLENMNRLDYDEK